LETELLKQFIITVLSLSLCWFWATLWIAGSNRNGHFYSYGITMPMVMYFWIPGWIVILGVIYFLVRKKKK